jgi:IclR family mhp operon transcriptional activator
MPTYPPVHAVTRALRLLRRLNQQDVTGLNELHQATRIPKPSLVRLLDTLIAIGLARNDETRKGYRLLPQVQDLSAGFHGGPVLVEAGAERCTALTRELKWPVSIAVLDGLDMMICFSTLRDSPVQPFGKILAKRRELLVTGLGRAYLAFCSDAERAVLIAMLREAETSATARKKIEPTVRGIVAEGARNGFVSRDPSMPVDGTSTLAAPIFAEDRILGTIGLTYFLSAIDQGEVARRAAAPLMEAARVIGKSAERLISQRRSLEARHFTMRGPADASRPAAKHSRRARQKN